MYATELGLCVDTSLVLYPLSHFSTFKNIYIYIYICTRECLWNPNPEACVRSQQCMILIPAFILQPIFTFFLNG